MSKDVVLQNPHTLHVSKESGTNNANGMRRSKVTEVESSMIEKEATELKHKDFVVALYLTGMHDNGAEERAHSMQTSICSREFNFQWDALVCRLGLI